MFVDTLSQLESDPACQGLKMQSFLTLPMQRITRLPLLVDVSFLHLYNVVCFCKLFEFV